MCYLQHTKKEGSLRLVVSVHLIWGNLAIHSVEMLKNTVMYYRYIEFAFKIFKFLFQFW